MTGSVGSRLISAFCMFICYDFLYASSVNTFDFGMSIVAFCNSGRPDICYMYIILLLQGFISCIVFMSCGKDRYDTHRGSLAMLAFGQCPVGLN